MSEEWIHFQASHQVSREEMFNLNLESVNYLFIPDKDNQKQDIFNQMVSWYYKYLAEKGMEENVKKKNKGCKFRMLNETFVRDNTRAPTASETNVKELCNNIRGPSCVIHGDMMK